jgi:hypothetical protein
MNVSQDIDMQYGEIYGNLIWWKKKKRRERPQYQELLSLKEKAINE